MTETMVPVSCEPTTDELLEELVAAIKSYQDSEKVSEWIESVVAPLVPGDNKVIREGRSGTWKSFPGDAAAEEIWSVFQDVPEVRSLLGKFSKKVSCQQSAIRDALHLLAGAVEVVAA